MKKSFPPFAIFLFYSFCSATLFAQGTGENFKFSSYKEFDLERGYNPGSFVVVKKKSVQSPIYTTEGLTRLLKDKTIFDFSAPVKIPKMVFDRKKNFIIGLEAKSKYEQLPAELKANLDKVRNVSLKVNEGVSYNLKNGTSALNDVIYALPLEALEKLLFEINKKNKLYMISDVIQYDDATLDFSWVTNFDTKLRSDIQKAVDLGVEAKWIDNATLQVKFAAGQLVGYKAIKIKKKYIKLIKQRIEYRKINGDDKVFYEDKDGDTFGNINNPKIQPKAPVGFVEDFNDINDNDKFSNRFFLDSDKDGQGDISQFKFLTKATDGYVKNSDDPDDNDKYNIMGAKLWYLDHDGDSFGDPNPKHGRFGVTKPVGYVADNRDCYDDNPNVFPGQNQYFAVHRGDNSWDYNCDGNSEKRLIQIGGCNPRCGDAEPAGWEDSIPGCGVDGSWLDDCDYVVSLFNGGCFKRYQRKTQECR